jgi:hypothetical protein
MSETMYRYTMLQLKLIDRKASWWYRNAHVICIAVTCWYLKRQKNVAAVAFFSARDAFEPIQTTVIIKRSKGVVLTNRFCLGISKWE